MISVLSCGLLALVLTFAIGVLPVQQQDDLQSLFTDLFPGQYWIEIDGALSNEGVMNQRVTEPGINNIRQLLLPFLIGDPRLSDPEQNDFGLTMDATIHDPESPDELSWATISISFDNILGQQPGQYAIVSREVANEMPEDTPQVSADMLLSHRDTSRFWFVHRVEGEAYVEEQREGDVLDWRIAFDFTAENEFNEIVHIRGAVYGRRYQDWIPDLLPREVEGAISGLIASSGTDDLDIQTVATEDGGLNFEFVSEFLGKQRHAPDEEVPIILHAEASMPHPEICEPTYAQLTSEYGTAQLIVAGEPFAIEDSIADPPVISICYEDADHATVSGIIAFQEFAPDTLDEYVSVLLYFRDIPVNQ